MLAKDFPEQRAINCETDIGNLSSSFQTNDMDVSITEFEKKFRENIMTFSNLVLYQPDKSPYSVEFSLSILMKGRDSSSDDKVPPPSDESPVLKELAVIDNVALALINNATVTVPRRFFRIGIAPVSLTFM